MTPAFVGLIVNTAILVLLLHVFHVRIDLAEILFTTVGIGCAITLYKYRYPLIGIFDETQRQRQSSLQRLCLFVDSTDDVFSLKAHGNELLDLLRLSINVTQACLLFPANGGKDYTTQFIAARHESGELNGFRLEADNLIIDYLKREHATLLRDELDTEPVFLGLWAREREQVQGRDISMFVPLISRDRLIAVLMLGSKVSGRFTTEDFNIISDISNRLVVSVEKEFLRTQLREGEEEQSVSNNSSAILSSSLDIQEIFGSFVEELKKVVDVSWATVILKDDGQIRCAAMSSPRYSDYQIGDSIRMEGSPVGWVIYNRKPFIESAMAQERCFTFREGHLHHGLRTVVYLPLIAKGRIIGCVIAASSRPNAYSERHVRMAEQLASQIALPLENSQLYARAEKNARLDELTGLLNRRSFDEMLEHQKARSSGCGECFSIILLDLDNFKSYNDTFGHPAGDGLLQRVASLLENNVKGSDSAFRFGGDEFAVLLPGGDSQTASAVAERLREKIENDQPPNTAKITASLGIAAYPPHIGDLQDVFQAADQALYEAKRSGKNRLCIFGSPQ